MRLYIYVSCEIVSGACKKYHKTSKLKSYTNYAYELQSQTADVHFVTYVCYIHQKDYVPYDLCDAGV